MKPAYHRGSSKSRIITDPTSYPVLDSPYMTPSIKPTPINEPPQIVLNPPSSHGTTISRQPQTPRISTEFLKRSIFDRLDDGLISAKTIKSYNNIGNIPSLPIGSTSINERVKSVGDSLKLQHLPIKKILNQQKKMTQSVERGQKNSVAFEDSELKGNETERLPGMDLKIQENKMRYTKLMMFIPKDLDLISAKRQQNPSFISFNDIAQTTKTTHPGMIEDLMTKSATLRKFDSKERVDSLEQLDIVKNILKFNRLQKAQYIEQMNNEAERAERKLTPMRKNSRLKLKGLRNSPSIRIVPSRRLHEPIYDMLDDKTDAEKSALTNSPERLTLNLNRTESSQRESSVIKGMTPVPRAISPGPDDYAVFGFGAHNYKFFWYPPAKEKGLWRPDAREGHTLTAVGKLLVSYGGLGNRVLDKIVIYDSENDVWAQPETKGEAPRAGRHSHTACEYKGNVVIFGGELRFNPTLGLRECSNDIHTFNPEKCEWKYVKALGKIDARRNHAATVYDRYMYVYGGISTEGTFMKDAWAYNFKAGQWTQLFPTGGREAGIAFHTMTACFNEKKDREKYKIAEEGLYVFGGKDEEGKILNTLKYLAISGKTCEWKYPTIKGPTPTARYNHATLLYKPLQLLLIHAGRNEYLYEQGVCLNDIRILHLESMTWGTSAAMGKVPTIGRSNHGAALLKTTLVIFGGVTVCEYANPDLRQVEINQLTTRKLIKEYMDTEEKQQTKTDKSTSPRTRRNLDPQEDIVKPEPKETKEPSFVSWQPLPLKQQFPIDDTLNKFKSAVRHAMLSNITKKLGNGNK